MNKKLFSIEACLFGYNFCFYIAKPRPNQGRNPPVYTIHKELNELWLDYDGDIVESVFISQIKRGKSEWEQGKIPVFNNNKVKFITLERETYLQFLYPEERPVFKLSYVLEVINHE